MAFAVDFYFCWIAVDFCSSVTLIVLDLMMVCSLFLWNICTLLVTGLAVARVIHDLRSNILDQGYAILVSSFDATYDGS